MYICLYGLGLGWSRYIFFQDVKEKTDFYSKK
jgi:hypothetical protein